MRRWQVRGSTWLSFGVKFADMRGFACEDHRVLPCCQPFWLDSEAPTCGWYHIADGIPGGAKSSLDARDVEVSVFVKFGNISALTLANVFSAPFSGCITHVTAFARDHRVPGAVSPTLSSWSPDGVITVREFIDFFPCRLQPPSKPIQ